MSGKSGTQAAPFRIGLQNWALIKVVTVQGR